MKRFEPKAVTVLTTARQTKAYMHPVRARILSMLTDAARTGSDVARGLGVHPANLTHHFRTLEAAGLIRLVETRTSGRALEKLYRATARQFDVALDGDELESKNKIALSILRRDLSTGLKKLADDDSDSIVALLERATINPEDMDRFRKKLRMLIDEFKAAEARDGAMHSINLSIYPNDSDYGPVGKVEFKSKRKK